MSKHRLLSTVGAAALAVFGFPFAAAQAAALTGVVSSAEEGAMEGVIVSAHKDGSNITVSVISDDKGHYAFPADKLSPGKYAITIRAAGWELDSAKSLDLADAAATNDVKLKKTKNLAKQLTNAEWMASIPGTDDQKRDMINCVSCHTLERIVRSSYDSDGFVAIQTRMSSYAQVSQPIKPQPRKEFSRSEDPEKRFRKMADYLATINLSESPTWNYELKTMPRVKGRGTHVVITEYDLPRKTIEPHDVIVFNGSVYYTNFGEQFLGKLDMTTGKPSEYEMKVFKPGWPTGNLDINPDKDGNLWVGMMYQAALAKFDPKTERFTYFPVSAERNKDDTQLNMVTLHQDLDGKIWTNDAGSQGILRLDVNTGKYEDLNPIAVLPGGKAQHSFYDIAPDASNNLFLTDFQSNTIMRVDAKDFSTKTYQVATPVARNRRGHMDAQGRFWFAEFRGNNIGMLDTTTEKTTEFPMPTKFTSPYDVVWDKNGDLWTGGMTTDRVVRLDPKTGAAVEYPLPRDTNMRRVFVDNSTPIPTFWVGSNHGASIVKVEPRD